MYFICTVTEWQTQRDGKSRITKLDKTGTRDFLLNAGRINGLKANGADKCIFYFNEDSTNRRESLSKIYANNTIGEVETSINLQFASKFITLPIYNKNDVNRSTSDLTVHSEDVSWADAYKPDPTKGCWLVYNQNSFRRVEVLCSLTLQEIEDLAAGTINTLIPTFDNTIITWDNILVTFDQAW